MRLLVFGDARGEHGRWGGREGREKHQGIVPKQGSEGGRARKNTDRHVAGARPRSNRPVLFSCCLLSARDSVLLSCCLLSGGNQVAT
eukprot:434433-Hanusia_phi.AAC.1